MCPERRSSMEDLQDERACVPACSDMGRSTRGTRRKGERLAELKLLEELAKGQGAAEGVRVERSNGLSASELFDVGRARGKGRDHAEIGT